MVTSFRKISFLPGDAMNPILSSIEDLNKSLPTLPYYTASCKVTEIKEKYLEVENPTNEMKEKIHLLDNTLKTVCDAKDTYLSLYRRALRLNSETEQNILLNEFKEVKVGTVFYRHYVEGLLENVDEMEFESDISPIKVCLQSPKWSPNALTPVKIVKKPDTVKTDFFESLEYKPQFVTKKSVPGFLIDYLTRFQPENSKVAVEEEIKLSEINMKYPFLYLDEEPIFGYLPQTSEDIQEVFSEMLSDKKTGLIFTCRGEMHACVIEEKTVTFFNPAGNQKLMEKPGPFILPVPFKQAGEYVSSILPFDRKFKNRNDVNFYEVESKILLKKGENLEEKVKNLPKDELTKLQQSWHRSDQFHNLKLLISMLKIPTNQTFDEDWLKNEIAKELPFFYQLIEKSVLDYKNEKVDAAKLFNDDFRSPVILEALGHIVITREFTQSTKLYRENEKERMKHLTSLMKLRPTKHFPKEKIIEEIKKFPNIQSYIGEFLLEGEYEIDISQQIATLSTCLKFYAKNWEKIEYYEQIRVDVREMLELQEKTFLHTDSIEYSFAALLQKHPKQVLKRFSSLQNLTKMNSLLALNQLYHLQKVPKMDESALFPSKYHISNEEHQDALKLLLDKTKLKLDLDESEFVSQLREKAKDMLPKKEEHIDKIKKADLSEALYYLQLLPLRDDLSLQEFDRAVRSLNSKDNFILFHELNWVFKKLSYAPETLSAILPTFIRLILPENESKIKPFVV